MPIIALKYNFKMYVKSYKYIMPFFIFITYIGMSYSIIPVDIVGSMTSSAVLNFALMAWIGFTYCNNTSSVAEHVLILKLNSHTRYWVSKIMLMTLIGTILSILSVGIPFGSNLFFGIFKYKPTFIDVFLAFVVHIIFSIIGALIGMLLQPRIISNRKMAMLSCVFIVLVSIVKDPLIKYLSCAKYIVWIFPPIGEFVTLSSNFTHFDSPNLIMSLIVMVIYALVESFILIKAMKKILF